ncbi:hypothetical protein GCM10017781_41980 [Deinococcus metalli]|uniref:Uncharacterized protein n=1 Tax=Deinococcus metalli TaxID=1141878 RepID=A0ABQ3JVZ4_9DEIO|nr:hypothetical protein GCM10017781_41980 [Deinococcus metalli]
MGKHLGDAGTDVETDPFCMLTEDLFHQRGVTGVILNEQDAQRARLDSHREVTGCVWHAVG